MEECVDGQYQDFKSKNGAYVREHFFGAYPELLELVADMTDDEIWNLNRGGHDPVKVYAAYAAAVAHTGQPTVILAKTVKGYGMGEAGEGQNITHQQKKMAEAALKVFRDRFGLLDPRRPAARLPLPAARRRQPRGRLPQGAPHGPGRLPAGPPAAVGVAGRARAVGLRCPAGRHRGARDLHHHGVRADPQHAAARQADRQAGRPDRARRVAHLRHGGDVPPVRHLVPGRPALPARGRQPADVLQGGPERPAPPGGHQRAGGDVVVDGRRHLLQQQRLPR